MNLSRYRLAHPGVGKVLINPVLVNSCIYMLLLRFNMDPSSNGWHYGTNFFKPEKNLEFFRLKICAIDANPGKLE